MPKKLVVLGTGPEPSAMLTHLAKSNLVRAGGILTERLCCEKELLGYAIREVHNGRQYVFTHKAMGNDPRCWGVCSEMLDNSAKALDWATRECPLVVADATTVMLRNQNVREAIAHALRSERVTLMVLPPSCKDVIADLENDRGLVVRWSPGIEPHVRHWLAAQF